MDSHYHPRRSYEDRPRGSGAWPALLPGDVENFTFDENPWAWADYVDDDSKRVDVSGASVTGVLVTLDAARWLPATLAALAKLDPRPTRLIAIDNASTDATPALLDDAYRQGVLDAVYLGNRTSDSAPRSKPLWSSIRRASNTKRTPSDSEQCP